MPTKQWCKHELQRRVEFAEARIMKLLEKEFGIPCARHQRAVWLSDNIEEFQERVKEARARQRTVSPRFRVCSELLTKVQRIPPQAERREPSSDLGRA
eukprot:11202716-Lingulodinium_polyedra.AAC.1